MEAVQRFRVESSGISAGAAAAGGAFPCMLKSGTNQFHGRAFGFRHDEAFDANTRDSNYWLDCRMPDSFDREAPRL